MYDFNLPRKSSASARLHSYIFRWINILFYLLIIKTLIRSCRRYSVKLSNWITKFLENLDQIWIYFWNLFYVNLMYFMMSWWSRSYTCVCYNTKNFLLFTTLSEYFDRILAFWIKVTRSRYEKVIKYRPKGYLLPAVTGPSHFLITKLFSSL